MPTVLNYDAMNNTLKKMVENMKAPALWLSNNQLVLNSPALNLFGYTENTAPDLRTWIKCLYGESLKVVEEVIFSSTKGQHSGLTFDFLAYSKDGRILYIRAFTFKLEEAQAWLLADVSDEHKFNQTTSNEISKLNTAHLEIKHLTQQLSEESAENSEENNHEQKLNLMEKMARIIAHEIRNPLTNIILSAEQIQQVIPEKDSLFPEIIIRNADKIEDLVRKFLNTFKREEINYDTVQIGAMLESCITDLKDTSRLHKVTVNLKIDNIDTPLELDREKIELVVHNLLSNAIDVCPTDGSGVVNIIAKKQEKSLVISIIDNGPGISVDEKTLFQPFFSGKPNGMGLGLTTSLNLIKSHHGEIEAHNKPEGGACFKVCLPYIKTMDTSTV